MHNSSYINTINEAAGKLGITVELLAENWAIELKKNGVIKHIVGYLFPLNDASSSKIANNKNLCSEILSRNSIANVPHQIVFSPAKLVERKKTIGNAELIRTFILNNSFPFLVKLNNSSKGVGVFLVKNEAELESILTKVYSTDAAFCLSPFRKDIKEYRSIILDGECLLSYEKQLPFVSGNGESTILELLVELINAKEKVFRQKPIFDQSIPINFADIPEINEKVFLQWQHNRYIGTKYEKISNKEIEFLAIKAAISIGSRFVSVDIIQSEKFGLEVLEINSSVNIHSPIYSPLDVNNYDKTTEIYQSALKKVFEL